MNVYQLIAQLLNVNTVIMIHHRDFFIQDFLFSKFKILLVSPFHGAMCFVFTYRNRYVPPELRLVE